MAFSSVIYKEPSYNYQIHFYFCAGSSLTHAARPSTTTKAVALLSRDQARNLEVQNLLENRDAANIQMLVCIFSPCLQ